jgi:hypothetical protein
VTVCHFVGNFGVAHSTESHLRQALEAVGVEVVLHQENHVRWHKLARQTNDADFVLWVTTHDYAPPRSYPEQRQFLAEMRGRTPVVGYHLDVWWELAREHRVREAPFFTADLVVTADGGHGDRWAEAGVNHRYMPPGVSEFECVPGTPRPEFEAPLAFVGSWQGYHPEHPHRAELVEFLQARGCAFWPKKGEHAIRNEPLRDLYASTLVNVGDSCFAGRVRAYHSDRVPECVGRGGFLLHPHVDAVTDGTLYTDGEHLRTWQVGDWVELGRLIDHYTAHPDEARAIGEKGRAHVLANHTYTVRMRELLELLKVEGLL